MPPFQTTILVAMLGVSAALEASPTEQASISVLATSAGTTFADTTAPLAMKQYTGLLTSILGLSSPTTYTWNGLLPAGLFNRPRAVASIIVEGPTIPFTSETTFAVAPGRVVTHSDDALSWLAGVHSQSPVAAVPTLVSDVFGSRATVVSVSGCPDAAALAGLSSGAAVSHTVTTKAGAYVDYALNGDVLELPSAIDWSQFDGVTFNSATSTATFGAAEFTGTDLEFFAELHTMLAVASALKNHADSHPSVLTFTIIKYASLASRHVAASAVTAAAQQIVAATVAKISAQIAVAYGEKAVVFGVSLGAAVNRIAMTDVDLAQERVRRQDNFGNTSNTSNYTTTALSMPLAAYAEYPEHFAVDSCSRYKCTCFRAYTAFQSSEQYLATCGTNCYDFSQYSNQSFAANSTTGELSAGCINVQVGEDKAAGKLCAWDQAACDCSNEAFFTDVDGINGVRFMYPGRRVGIFAGETNETGNVSIQAQVSLRYQVSRNPNRRMSTDAKCVHCAYGFTLSNGYCYEDSTETAAGQAALWTWLAGSAGLIGMWYVLHSITDGGKWAYLGDVPDMPDTKKTS